MRLYCRRGDGEWPSGWGTVESSLDIDALARGAAAQGVRACRLGNDKFSWLLRCVSGLESYMWINQDKSRYEVDLITYALVAVSGATHQEVYWDRGSPYGSHP